MTQTIYICGFMGSGKTTIGRLLAEQLHVKFIDTDEEIQHAENAFIKDIFAIQGEAYFRKIECEIMKRIAADQESKVVALGGGSLMNGENLVGVLSSGYLIYLKNDLELLRRRLKNDFARPLLQKEELENLFEIRSPGYERANFIFDVKDFEPEAAAFALYRHVINLEL